MHYKKKKGGAQQEMKYVNKATKGSKPN